MHAFYSECVKYSFSFLVHFSRHLKILVKSYDFFCKMASKFVLKFHNITKFAVTPVDLRDVTDAQ
jgi:hypothetical protein